MRLQHFTKKPLSILEKRIQILHESSHDKPKGLWVSDEDAEDSWSWWCQSEGDHTRSWLEGTHVYNVTLHPQAKVLHLATEDEVRQFSRQAGYMDRYGMHGIAWPAIANAWDGILITPYQWECRLDMETNWYYGWDCASGCIWEPRAIESIDLVKVNA